MAESNADNWWRNAVVYEVYPRSFNDSNGDGEGDFRGIIDRLDYLHDLGVDALWLTPFYPSPLADGGYDVADYCGVDPRFGTLRQFADLVARAHDRGIRIIIDIVPNHTSDKHPWFTRALHSAPGSKERNRYIFHVGRGEHGEQPPTNWLSNFGGSAWEPCGDGWYYLHSFAKEQPDLNWDNPEVQQDFLDILRFWCEQGVDGFRIDVSHGLVKDLREPLRDRPDPALMSPQAADGSDPLWDRDGVHEIYRQWRELLNQYTPVKYAIGESWTPFTPRVYQYARQDELGSIFDFSLLKAAWDRDDYRKIIDRTGVCAAAAGSAPVWVLRNHDVPRLASRIALPKGADVEHWVTSDGRDPSIDPARGERRARAEALLMLGLPGTAFIYQGDELGLPEDLDLRSADVQDPIWERSGHRFKGRDGCRVPLPWNSDSVSFGFSQSSHPWLPQPAWYARFAVSNQEGSPESMLNLYRAAIAERRHWIGPGDEAEWLTDGEYAEDGLGWRVSSGLEVLVNFSSEHAIRLPEEATVLLNSCPERTDRANKQVPPESAVWYFRGAPVSRSKENQ